MKTIYNEIGFSLVFGKGNWIGLSYEIEEGKDEIRGLGWKRLKKIRDIYFRGQLLKKMIVISSKDGVITKNKDKFALKFMFGISNKQ